MSKLTTPEELIKLLTRKQAYVACTFRYLSEQGQSAAPLRQLWGNYIPEGAFIHFPSLRGSGKSLLMYQLCLAIVAGQKSFLGEKIDINGTALYLDFEMPARFLSIRSAKLANTPPFPIDTKGEDLIVFNSRHSLLKEFPIVIQLIEQQKPVLIVVDNLRTAARGLNTNSSKEIADFFLVLAGIREKFNTAIVIIDHLKKGTKNLIGDSDLQSGSGAKTDLVDGDFLLRHSCQQKDLRILKRVKSRLTEESNEVKLIKLNPETMWFELIQEDVNESEHIGLSAIEDKDEQKDMAEALRKEGKSLDEIARILHKGKTTIHRWLKEPV
jgi:RecA-family ATPase